MRYVLGIDAGGTKTRALLADETGQVVGTALGGGANLKTHGELEVEKVLHHVAEVAESRAGFRPEAVALGIAGADRPHDQAVLAGVFKRIGFKSHVVITNDARIAFVAGSDRRGGLPLVCGPGSIPWGRHAPRGVAPPRGRGGHSGGGGAWLLIREGAARFGFP